MKSLILPFSFLVKISVLSLLFFVTAAPSIIDNTRAVGLQEKENNVAEGHHSDDLSSPKKSLGVLMCLPSCQVDGVCKPSCTKSKKPSHESTFGDGDGKHEVWTNGNATSIQKPGSKKPTCSLHDSVHC